MRFDFGSFLIGLAAGLGLARFLYVQREAVHRLWDAVMARMRQLRDQLTAGVEARYQAALRARCDELWLTQAQAPFDALYIEQYFDPPPARPSTTPPNPAAASPISLSVALRSAQRLAVLGESGSGRTSLLIKLARLYSDGQAPAQLGTPNSTPLLLHLAEIDWANVADNDPLSPLVTAASAHVLRLIAPNVSSLLKNRVRSNSAILLLDGLDELTPALRPQVIQWLAALLDKYPDNQVVIATGLYGYATLHDLGFTPLRLAAWSATETRQVAQRWVRLVSGGKQDEAVLANGLTHLAGVAPKPIDLAIAATVWQVQVSVPADKLEAYERWIDPAIRVEGNAEHAASDKIKAALARAAWTCYQENRITLTEDDLAEAKPDALPAAPAAEVSDRVAPAMQEVLNRTRALIAFGSDGWTFAHRQLAAYLAAWHAVQTNAALEIFWDQPEWSDVLEFYAALADPGEFIHRSLTSSDDIGRSHLWTAARWTGASRSDAPPRPVGHPGVTTPKTTEWRSKVMGELARAFLEPDQYGPMRRRALNSLLATRDKGLSYLLKRGLAQPDPDIRALGLRGLASLGRESDLPVFNAALADQAPQVRAEAIRALGAAAHITKLLLPIERLVQVLLEKDEDDRRLAAEVLATCGEEGHQILREGVAEEDLKVRRATAYGLAAAGEPWARELLQTLQRDDTQWYVRSAALDALKIMDLHERKPVDDPTFDTSPVKIDEQGWLVEWAAGQGIGIGVGRQAVNALMRALDEGPISVRLAAIQTLSHAGDLAYHDKLRQLLYDPDRSVREAAFAALEMIGQRLGQPIPR